MYIYNPRLMEKIENYTTKVIIWARYLYWNSEENTYIFNNFDIQKWFWIKRNQWKKQKELKKIYEETMLEKEIQAYVSKSEKE